MSPATTSPSTPTPLDRLTSLFSASHLETKSSGSSSSSISNSDLLSSPASIAVISSLGTTALVLGGISGYRRYWKRFTTAENVPGKIIQGKKWIKGVVTSVGDGDGFRLYHTPGPFYTFPFNFRKVPTLPKDLKDQTISIRIAAIDAPETAHFGRPAQVHSKESLDWLRERLLLPTRRKVKCQIVRRDQYGRIVAIPYVKRLFLPAQPLPIEMLKKGQATVYASAGAEYGPWTFDHLKDLEDKARGKKLGVWGARGFERPEDYKKRYRVGEGEDGK